MSVRSASMRIDLDPLRPDLFCALVGFLRPADDDVSAHVPLTADETNKQRIQCWADAELGQEEDEAGRRRRRREEERGHRG